jgi:2-aminoadipate transaminase
MLLHPFSPTPAVNDFLPMSSGDSLSRRAHWSAGQPISYLMHMALAKPSLISLAAGFVDQHSLPVEPARKALDAILNDPVAARAALQYGTTHGYHLLREQIVERLLAADRGRPGSIALEQVVLTAGSNELLHVVCDSLLDPGDIVLVGSPNYFVFLGMLANLGARSVGIASDEKGLVPEALDETLRKLAESGELSRVKAVYVASYFDNPRSITLAADRRPALVEIVRRWSKDQSIYILEDTAYRELRYAGDDVPTIRSFDESGELVVCTGTFSKSFSPGVRVGWGVLPRPLAQAVLNQKGNIDFGSPNFSQHLISKVLELGLHEPHVASIRKTYLEKLNAMLAACDEYLRPLGVRYQRPSGGLYVWAEMPDGIDTGADGPLFQHAMEAGVLYVPGSYCYPSEGTPTPSNTMRLSFGVQSPENIRRGIRLLADAIGAEVGAPQLRT